MPDTQKLITAVYAAFNHRDIDAALQLMTESVRWPKASEGGHIVGKDEIRAYWGRQWQTFDPHVEPLEIVERSTGEAEVRVHQVVKGMDGALLSDSEVRHIYTISDGLIDRMDLDAADGAGSAPTAAFARH